MEITKDNVKQLAIGQTCWLQHGTHEPTQVYISNISCAKHDVIISTRCGENGFYGYEVTLPQITKWDNRLFTCKKDALQAFQNFI